MAERGVDNITGTSEKHVAVSKKKSKPPPKTPAERQRTYRLKKKLMKEAQNILTTNQPSESAAPVIAVQSPPSSPEVPRIIEHEVVIETVPSRPIKIQKSVNVLSKRWKQRLSEVNFDEIRQLPSQSTLPSSLPNDEIQQILNQPIENDVEASMQPQNLHDGNDSVYADSVIEDEQIDNEDDLNLEDIVLPEMSESSPIIIPDDELPIIITNVESVASSANKTNLTLDSDNTQRQHHLTPGVTVKSVIRRVYQKCKKESETLCLHAPIKDYEARALEYTGYTLDYDDQHPRDYTAISHIDISARIKILQYINENYAMQRSFTYENIYERIRNLNINVPDFANFLKGILLLGFEYKPTNIIPVIIEDPALTCERFQYLNQIKKARSMDDTTIYYIDERIVDMSFTFKKPWIYNIDTSTVSLNRFILAHIVCKSGLVNSLFFGQMSANDFKKWLIDLVLPSLRPASIIVIDQNPIRNDFIKKRITKYHSKKEMYDWLQDNNIPCNLNMRKYEIYSLIQKFNYKNENHYCIDEVLASHGHKVLRLPKHYHDITPTEIMWRQIKVEFSLNQDININNMGKLKDKITSVLQSFKEKKWVEFDKTVEIIENKLWRIDEEIEKNLNNYNFCCEQSHEQNILTSIDINDSDGESSSVV